ncbi:MAG: hypothetical protein ORN29_01540 [Rhodoferax sp.]|nr:hypothetical protein [Rhodoferax sp.]
MHPATATITVTPAAVEDFQKFYLTELDERIKRSEMVGAITLKKGSAALFYDAKDGKFSLVEKIPNVEAANVFDCIPREQWGRMIMLFGHANNTGGYIPSGHAILDGNSLKIKLASGHYYRIEVDSTLPHLLPYYCAEPPKPPEDKTSRLKRSPLRTNSAGNGKVRHLPRHAAAAQGEALQEQDHRYAGAREESEDLTEEDLRRLRGEIPLSAKPKKKWKH